jgi:molybdopterin synthase catalytic subunit
VDARLTHDLLDVAEAHRRLADPNAGGVVVFVGRVRSDRSRAGVVRALFYEADERMALRGLRHLVRTAKRSPGVRRVVVWHRLGTLGVGEVSVVVGVAAVHRDQAFRTARFLIDRVKIDVPIWKTDRARPVRRPPRRPAPPAARSAGSGRARRPRGPPPRVG